ncbi:MAG: V-type ATPase 116kDa subunit family protein [Bacteroidales bacterium]|nr:V-type ATPase 116kDa subunit family protein [Bacteroidales bacterium]
MITPMTKLSMLIYHRDYHHFLENLRDQGVVHVHTKKKSFEDETLKAKLVESKRTKAMIALLSKRPTSTHSVASDKAGSDLLNFLEDTFKNIENQQQKIVSLQKEDAVYHPWGGFPETTLKEIQSNNWDVRFFTTPARKYNPQWEQDYNAFVINELTGVTYFTTILPKGKEVAVDAEKYQFPQLSKTDIEKEIQQIQDDIVQEQQMLNDVAKNAIQGLEKYLQQIKEAADFFKVSDAADKLADEKLLLLEGWVPTNLEAKIVSWLDGQSVYYEATKPEIDKDDPPIKLKNNAFAQLFEFLGEMYSIPTYWELDLTPFFAPFYVMFFGLCLGDAGYGLFMVLAVLALLLSKKLPKMKSVLWFGFFIGLGTTIMGTISGTFFGIPLLNVDIPFVNSLKGFMFKDGGWFSAFNFSLMIGVVQIMFGMFLKVINLTKLHGFGAAVSTIGWIVLLLGGGISYYLTGIGTTFYIVMGIGALLVFILNSPIRKFYDPLVNIGSGLWDAYNMATGLLGDVLSYIRLFALGLSGSILGLVFNDLAMKMSGDIPVVSQLIMILILLFGHTINFAISGLGAFVHPMRLTFVEFYKNAGFKGGGRKYEPFQKIEK